MPCAICLLPLLLAFTLYAQNAEQPPDAQAQDLHWAIKLGLRSHQVAQAFPLVDRVVLVPDAATYLDELAKWSPRGRWPVLFDEPRYAPMFVRRFKPAEVVRRPSVGALVSDARDLERRLEQIVVTAWGGDPALHSITQIFERQTFIPPGVVVTSAEDPAWTAAVALAAGHGQPIVFLDGGFGEDRGVASDRLLERFHTQLDEALAHVPYVRKGLGDEFDALTVCRSLPSRTRVPGGAPNEFEGVAFMDAIARNENESRWALTGWIFGDEARSAYVAMCSLFLERTEALLINTYPDDGQWASYGLFNVSEAMRQIGFAPLLRNSNWATLDNWLRMLPAGVRSDVIFINTRGMRDFFELAAGRAHACDVPMLNTPAAVHFIHSFSMAIPADRATVAGRWIDHGAYAYVGSVTEPTLAGFIPPIMITERLVNFVPFLVAVRHWDEPWSKPGKISTYGDPLMLIAPPEKVKKERIADGPPVGGVDLLEHARALMKQVKDEPDAEAFAEAIEALVMLGKDEIAVELWKHARDAGMPAAGARHALGAFFRLYRRGEFMQAWDASLTRTDADADMLWHLWTSALDGAGKDVLLQLQSAIRPGQPEVDLERLLPHLRRAFGEEHAIRVLDREIEKATDDRTRKRLRELRRRN